MDNLITEPDLTSYDHIILYFSGGKDSLACLLHLLDQGIDTGKLELHHHEVDGREGSTLMDWPITPDYCRAIARHFGLPLYFSWREGGFEREMLRHNDRTAPVIFETPDAGLQQAGGINGPLGTRELFPQVSADLRVRWCSAALKIDAGAAALRNQARFLGKRVLTISGERAQESTARAHYSTFEPDRTDNRDGAQRQRTVDRYRPIHGWAEAQVWEIIGRYRIFAHPCYYLGFGRASCMKCIFLSDDLWATVDVIDPAGVDQLAEYEELFGKTIHRTMSIRERIQRGKAKQLDPVMVALAMGTEFTLPVLMENWVLPAGAYGDLSGPC